MAATYLSSSLYTCFLVSRNSLRLSYSLNSSNIIGVRHITKMKGLVLGAYTESGNNGSEISESTNSFKDVDKKYGGKLSAVLKGTGPFCKSVKQKLLWGPILNEAKLDFDCISVVDLGNKDVKYNPNEGRDPAAENVRCAIAEGIKALRAAADFQDIFLDSCDHPKNVGEGAYLTVFVDDQCKQKDKCKPAPQVHLYHYDQISESDKQEFEKGKVLAECQNFSRILMNTPANFLTPTIFASTMTEKFKSTNVEVVVRDENWIKSMKMGSFLSVAKGSDEKPIFLELHYNGAPESKDCIALVGKGITFDSGGISLKPPKDMDKMRYDMGGAACVVSSVLAASLLKLKVNIRAFTPLCENLPSGKSNKPGDVVYAMNGKSIQVDNTDAEGRLVLCDALCYAQQFKPFAILDMATLTGAIAVALGPGATGVFSNDDGMWELIDKAGKITGDRVWRMPLFSLYKNMMTDCDLADLNNISKSGPYGGSCQAAAFLQEFIEKDVKWLHLDIAGVADNKDKSPYYVKGMSGRPTRTVVQFLQDLEDKFQS